MISKQIHTTSMKLQTLSQQPTLERSVRICGNINKLTFSIKSDITFLNRQLELLECSDSGSSRGGPQTKEHHSAVVGQLQKDCSVPRKVFKVCSSRSETMKAQSDRRVKFGQHRPANSLGRPLNFRRHEERAFMSSKGNTTETDELYRT